MREKADDDAGAGEISCRRTWRKYGNMKMKVFLF
jgi:hypothetical protein